MNKERIKVVVPQELVEELSTIDGFEIDKTVEEPTAIKNFDFDLSAMINPENMNSVLNTIVAVFGFLSSVNGAVSLAEKIKKYFEKSGKNAKRIRIFTSTKQYIIDQNSNPEVFQEIENIINK